jgi:hypothetical protein
VSAVPPTLRRQLEHAIKQARPIAEGGARKALEALAVHEPDPYRHMDKAQRDLRRKLRAQARQLGDRESQTRPGAYDIKHLVEKLAYDQWHRILFARFLLENNLLISPEHGVSVSVDDCEELALSLGLKDAWAVAAQFAAKELPNIFRADDPAGALELPVEDRNPLVQIVTGLPVGVFNADDSLGWCYQFWQAERKDAINAAGNKIGADDLPAVTQLFTEDYMVDFLLDNTLGAWHAGKVLAATPTLADTAQSEEELRNTVTLPGCPWKYLRFIKATDGRWTPAAGTFDGWPTKAKAVACLDPCMGSGHFVVAMFERLVALRMDEEMLNPAAAVAAVIRDNLFGLEIDLRCTQIAAFNLALGAWRRVGYCQLPAMNLACSGLAPNTKEEDWLKLAGDDEKLQRGMKRLHRLFEDAPVLGSLINPRAAEDNLRVAGFKELQPLLERALAQETKDDTAYEMAVTASGLAGAAEILAGQFTLIATNVPYLGRGKQDEVLQDYCERAHPEAKADLATSFIERCFDFCAVNGSTALVTPQNWLFLATYKSMRERSLRSKNWSAICRLGPGAFETIGGEVVSVALLIIARAHPTPATQSLCLDAAGCGSPSDKAIALRTIPSEMIPQIDQIANPDAIVAVERLTREKLLESYAKGLQGISSADNARFRICFWEVTDPRIWEFMQSSPPDNRPYGGRENMLWWGAGGRALAEANPGAALRGEVAHGKWGVAVARMAALPATLYSGELFDDATAIISPREQSHIPAIWTFCSSGDFQKEVRRINQKVSVANATLVKVPFDIAHWQRMATEKYPRGLPKPFSSDPTQWLFNGHPRESDQPLHVAVARLLGYQWPRQTGSSFPDCPALGPDGLVKLADADGIVCLSAAKGEPPAAERLRSLLVQAMGTFDLSALIDAAGRKGSTSETLEEWLRDEFFEQHCALFHHRPFIWHIWDGHKSGFSALVNYHKLTHANLEKLTFAYIGDWIRRQQAAVHAGETGSDARLQAAKQLQATLKRILEGEPPYDLFVRWKPLSQQAIGWYPDINDGVRLNIHPFLVQNMPGGKKGAGVLRTKPNIKWEKDRGKELVRNKKDFPWFWGWDEAKQDFAGIGKEPDGNRWNDCHYTNATKQTSRAAKRT